MQEVQLSFFPQRGRSNGRFFTKLGTFSQLGSTPLYLINRALDHAEQCKAQIVLVAPLWKSAVFWPKVTKILEGDCTILRNKVIVGDVFVKGKTNTSIFRSEKWIGKSIAMHIDFR